MGKRSKRMERKSPTSHGIIEDMEAKLASYTIYKGIKFRLPALQLDAVKNPRKKGHNRDSPREARALNTSESALKDKRMKEWLQKRTALLKRNGKKVRSELNGRKTSEIEVHEEGLKDSYDAMGFLARELTEVKDALENNKTKIKADTLKGLKKVIAGVLHTLRRDQLKVVLDSIYTSSSTKYENISQAISLSPRIVKKIEKREPVNREVHVCKGCKEGGHLPWMYLYPDNEVYRTGGGFDCVEFLLPAIHSEKPLTKPRDPFEKPRGKLVDTSMHKLPEKLPVHATKPIPFTFKKKKHDLGKLYRRPQTEINSSSIREIEFKKRRRRSVPGFEEKKSEDRIYSPNGLPRDVPMHSSFETITFSRDKESDLLNNTISSNSSNNTLSFGWQRSKFSLEADSGVATAASSVSESHSLENVAVDLKDLDKKLQLNELNSLQQRLSRLHSQGSVYVDKHKMQDEVPKGPKKLVVRKSMAVTTNAKSVNSIHNSAALSQNHETSNTKRNAFGVRMKPIKSIPNRKKSKAVDVTSLKESSGSTASEISVNFLASLSLDAASQKDSDNGSDFTLTGSQVTAMTRFSKDSRRAPKERKISRPSKHLDDGKSKLEEDKEKEMRNVKEKKQKESISGSETTVFVDIMSSLKAESTSPESLETQSSSGIFFNEGSIVTVGEEKAEIDTAECMLSSASFFKDTDDVDGDFFQMGEEAEEFEEDFVNGDNDDDDDDIDEEGDEEGDELDDLPEIESKAGGKKTRKKFKKRRTLKFRTEPLSRFSLKRRHHEDSELMEDIENEDDLSMLDYAARYCIISLQKLSKYENVFTSHANCEGEGQEHENDGFGLDTPIESEEQRRILKDYEKLMYSLDMYQQRISEGERKRAELDGEREAVLRSISDLQIDEKKKKLLEKSIQAFSKKILTVDERVKNFVCNVKKLIEEKRNLEDKLRESRMDSRTVDKIIKNGDFLGRKFTKMKCLKIKIEDVPNALTSINPNLDEEDFQFVSHVLKLPEEDCLDFKAFAVVCALAERVKSLDKSIKVFLKDVDLGTLERKLDKCKELYRLLSEEHHDGQRTVPLENLMVELKAGGLHKDHQRSIVDKLNHHGHGFVDFLDFVLYIPLFLMIHDQIVQKPFH